MNPYTPNRNSLSRRKNLALSTKEYTKVTGTIASVRRNRQGIEEEDEDVYDGRIQHDRRGAPIEPSFIAEESFVRAPLNSRVRVASGASAPKYKGKAKEEQLETMPLEIQEAVILEDLLYVLMGIEGTHVTYHEDYSPEDDDPLQGIKFTVSRKLDQSLRDLVERILPLATYYTAVSSFIELRSHLDFGLVNHALCAAIRDMLKDYQTLLSQLEHAYSTSPQFTLQKLWFYVHPTVHTLHLIYQLTTELANADDSASSSHSSEDEEDEEDAERNEALGLGGAGLKAVLSQIDGGVIEASSIAVKGGEVLAILHDRVQNMAGDPAAKTVYGVLLEAAGKPYVAMLQMWTRTGRLVDPYEELCVKESKFIDRGTLDKDYTDEYWDRRYTLRDGSTLSAPNTRLQAGVPPPRNMSGRLPGGACIPPLLESWKHKVLLAGKYLNVIRECGIDVRRDKSIIEESYSMDDEKFYKSIEDDYTYANRTLLQLLIKDQDLIPRLRCLKRYFFLSHASFLTNFLDTAYPELRRPVKSVSVSKLQSLLDIVLNADAHGDDVMFREDVRVALAQGGLYDWLLKVVSVNGVIGFEEGVENGGHAQKEKDDKKQISAIDVFTLDFNVKFPLSLVISRNTILRYQLIFRFLLHLKSVEQALSAMWIDQKATPWRVPMPQQPEFEKWRLRVFVLRARMLAWVQQILAFVTFEVLEPNWRTLEAKLAKVTTVDQLLRDHVDFLDTCTKECMLTSSRLLKAYSKLIMTCSTFSLYTMHLTKSAVHVVSASESGEVGQSTSEKRWEFFTKFETNFNHWLRVHIDCVQYYAASENMALLPLVVRLNSIKVST